MPSHLSNPWNNAVAFLTMAYGEQDISTGSCFFWAHGERRYLVTNWHNFTGRNHLTKQPMSSTGALPDRIIFMAYKQLSEPDAAGFFELRFTPITVQLCDSDFSNPRWLEHPTHGHKVDVAAIDITDVSRGFQIRAANELENNAQCDAIASQDVFIVGFPFGLIANAPAPLWKRGSVALDPSFDPENLPKMLIDTATRPGMSGSVVIARHIVIGRSYKKKDGSDSEPVLYAELDLVAGVYSGRHYPDLEKAQLGIVWKRKAIEETVAAGKKYEV
jgi:hypothetical protein